MRKMLAENPKYSRIMNKIHANEEDVQNSTQKTLPGEHPTNTNTRCVLVPDFGSTTRWRIFHAMMWAIHAREIMMPMAAPLRRVRASCRCLCVPTWVGTYNEGQLWVPFAKESTNPHAKWT